MKEWRRERGREKSAVMIGNRKGKVGEKEIGNQKRREERRKRRKKMMGRGKDEGCLKE